MAIWKSLVVTAALVAAVADAAALRPRNNTVTSEALRKSLDIEALKSKAQILQDIAYSSPDKNRVIGSQGHEDTVAYIHDQIAKFPEYYTVELQPVPIRIGVSANLTASNQSIEVYPVSLAPSGHVTGPLVAIPNLGCDASDFPSSLEGKIALIFRGTCSFGYKVGFASGRGALGVIAYNNADGNLNGYSLSVLENATTPYIPTGGISRTAGEALVAQLNSGAEIIVDLTTESKTIATNNIIAQTTGGDPNNVIHIGGHSDSVAAGPGINDNGSGSLAILEIALQLTNFSVNNAVRFSWWTAEEEGLLGASYYVAQLPQAEKDKIRLFLDFDMMASPNFAYQIYDGDGSAYNLTGPAGSAEAEKEFTNYFTNIAKLNHTEIEFDGRSDYGPFLEAGIAAGGIAGGAEGLKTEEEVLLFGGAAGVQYDVNYHEDGDTVDNLNHECWIEMSRAIAHMVATYAQSFDSLPSKKAARRGTVAHKKTKTHQRWI
ncbi:Zn-dependent exopeptidase [Pleomassaria siparia CBS 279.74]|uniref:Peptide hydrolase n=1 Tax=Pleomassaria siparia CBS 279.74 TaxID=1314801 RepID=A0A6G1JXS0_9PLEO|nr:Zn-dependent exopeptidase [Pleomassaria siparia CBS 279.74]